ncbi:patatin-like phospholipase domain-containing protein 2 isoform X2 [Anoplolepis gracilipes]|uniref:patatin-like phospholipase domain-containing protein 2 isoform X2 n=1 Tax=Anoplolepis gracilipes TaxID=354296 RepID=UPI003BA3DE8F
MNLSFTGGGFLGIYHVGVAIGLKKYASHLVDKASGASAGAIAACCLLCEETVNGVLHIAEAARKYTVLGPFSPYFNVQRVLLEVLEKILPGDVHIRVNGKLHISLTRMYDMKNVIISQFDSREDLLQALLATSFVPLFSGLLPPRFHGMRYMDGGFSDNLPMFDENTITVCPFSGESDICPRDPLHHLYNVNVCNMNVELSKQNLYRIAQAFFPSKTEILLSVCKQGYDDALQFLRRRNLLE